MPDESEAQLLERWRAGDDAAGQRVCERHRELVARIVAAHRPRSVARDDLVQEVFLTMFARSETYTTREGTPFAHWLARLATNVCRDALRAEARRPPPSELSAEASEALTWLNDGARVAREDAAAARELVERLLSMLPPEDRAVLTLLDLEGRSVADIAELFGWSRTLVKVRAFRARLRLRAAASTMRGDRR